MLPHSHARFVAKHTPMWRRYRCRAHALCAISIKQRHSVCSRCRAVLHTCRRNGTVLQTTNDNNDTERERQRESTHIGNVISSTSQADCSQTIQNTHSHRSTDPPTPKPPNTHKVTHSNVIIVRASCKPAALLPRSDRHHPRRCCWCRFCFAVYG